MCHSSAGAALSCGTKHWSTPALSSGDSNKEPAVVLLGLVREMVSRPAVSCGGGG